MKRASIKMAILLPSLAVLIAGIIIMVAISGVLSSNSTQNLTGRLMNARVNEYANEFEALCLDVYGAAAVTAPIISNYIDPDFVKDVIDPRGEVIDILSKALISNGKIAAMWTCWEPNAFDGKDSDFINTSFSDATGRYIPYVYRNGNNFEVEALVGYDSPVLGEYYLGARDTGKPYITDPYLYSFGGVETYIYTISIPIFQNGKVAGVVGADVMLHDAIEVMNSGSILDDGYLLTISPGGLVATHRNESLLLTHYTGVWMRDYKTQVEGIIANGGSFSVDAYSDVTNSNITFLGSGVMIGDTGRHWVICGVVPEKTVNASSTTLVWMIIIIGLALIVMVGVTIFLIVGSRLKELPRLTATAEAIAIGDIDSASLNAGTEATKNEISLLARAFYKMTAGIRQQADVLHQISLGDYSVAIPVRSDKDVMNRAINQMLDSTNDALNQISSAAGQVSTGSRQIADGAQTLAKGAVDQAATVEQLSASISEVAAKTGQNADMAKEAAKLSDVIKRSAEKGSLQMDQMMQAVKEINEASNSIGRVIKVIDDIAFQTNILALNAAIEAARAGQHGSGFAVVADEVRSLAAKSAQAAKDTEGLIANSIEKANMGFTIAEDTSASLGEIVDGINRSVEIITKIDISSDEQAGAIKMINTGIDQVTHVVQQNSATAEQSAAASEEMSGQSSVLNQLISMFKLRDSGNQHSSHSGYLS